MAVIEGGVSGSLADVGLAASNPLHATTKPISYGAFGHYAWGGFSGIIPAALAANSEIFQFRWTDATRLAVILRVSISACVTTTFFGAGVPVQLDLVKATAWTGAGTGGTAVSPAALNKLRTSMGSSLVASGDIRIATTAALGAGTKTLETNSLATILGPGPTANPGTIFAPTVLFDCDIADAQHPLVMATNEGFIIRSVAVPATGTWQFTVSITWAETTLF